MTTHRLWLSLACCAVMTLAAGCCSCEDDFLEPATLEPAQIEALARLKLPAGARVTHHKANSFGPDAAIWLRVTLPSDQVDGFLEASGHTPDPSFKPLQGTQVQWWRTGELPDPRSATREDPGFLSRVVVGQADAPTQTLYLFAHEF